jgi:GTP cyclohydrolase II
MSATHSPANSALFGNEGHLSVSRTLSELQGRRIRINAPDEVLFTLPWRALTTNGCVNLWRSAVQMRRS